MTHQSSSEQPDRFADETPRSGGYTFRRSDES